MGKSVRQVDQKRFRPYLLAAVVLFIALTTLAACSEPELGNKAIYCARLDSGSAKSSSPTAEDLAALVEVAPPEIRANVQALSDRAADFGDLLEADETDLKALFLSKFDPEVEAEQRAFDNYAQQECGITISRSPLTKWNAFLNRHYSSELWSSQLNVQFDRQGTAIAAATLLFTKEPTNREDLESACTAVAHFLSNEGALDASIEIVVDTAVVATFDRPDQGCEIPA